MDSFISRNSLAALFFLGLMVFGISNLVGTDGEDGLLMKAARDFTGEAESGGDEAERAKASPVAATPAPAPPAASAPSIEGEFYDDSDLIDSASGFNPSPHLDEQSEVESDEAMILPSSQSPAGPASAPVAGGLVGNGNIVVSDNDDEDYE